MNEHRHSSIRIQVDPTNPGQFFACCGLLELAERHWNGAEAWYENGGFRLRPIADHRSDAASLIGLLNAIAGASLEQLDASDDYSSPIALPSPFNLRLDWWKDDRAGGKSLKVWAGSMRSVRIARAMQAILLRPEAQGEAILDYAVVVFDQIETDKKVEPYYFDARRGSASQAIDIGFSPDSLQMTTLAFPAVEFLCLVGLQRFRPMPTSKPRIFDYYTWEVPLDVHAAQSAVCGLLPGMSRLGFRFENAFRTDQRKHKAFTPATPMTRSLL